MIRAANGDVVPVTVSIGVAVQRPDESQDALLHRADRAMYAAKTGGRNRVCAETDEPAIASAHPSHHQLRARR